MEKQQNSAIPNSVKRLKLCSSLNDCGKRRVEDCLKQSSARVLYVYDDDVLGYSDWIDTMPADVSRSFIARNDQTVGIVLLPLDNCIISGPAVKIDGVCDCAILTEKQMSFVEFKTNVKSNSDKNLEDKTCEAIGQLMHTFNGIIAPRCAKRNVDLAKEVDIDFFVIFDSNLDVTNVTAFRMNLQMKFLQETGFPLFFSNEKSFK